MRMIKQHAGDRLLPVKHSTNLNFSTSAIRSIIFELTVDATIASLSMLKT